MGNVLTSNYNVCICIFLKVSIFLNCAFLQIICLSLIFSQPFPAEQLLYLTHSFCSAPVPLRKFTLSLIMYIIPQDHQSPIRWHSEMNHLFPKFSTKKALWIGSVCPRKVTDPFNPFAALAGELRYQSPVVEDFCT